MKKMLTGLVFAAASLASISPTTAAVVYGGTAAGLGNAPGATTFDTATTADLSSSYTQAGSNLTFATTAGSAQILNTATSGANGAEPFGDATPYLSVLGNGVVTVTLSAPVNRLSFYWGSIDSYNTITFSDGTSFTGADIAPKSATGCQQSTDCNGLVTFNDPNGTFTSFTLSSGANSFEADNFDAVVALASGIPELSTWSMLTLGFLGLGLLGYRHKGSPEFRAV